jgi:hypothetical protein
MDQVKVAKLGEILGAGVYDELVEAMDDGRREAPSGERGLYRVPDSIRDEMATVREVQGPAEQWVATDELRLDRWTVEDACELLTDLRVLAQKARSESRHLWVWWSL